MKLEELRYKMKHGPFQVSSDDIELFTNIMAVVEAADRMAEMYWYQEVEANSPTPVWLADYYKARKELEKE